MRQIIFDTETTGLYPEQGHRLIEIGAVELIQRKRSGRYFHYELNPEREIDAEATRVHGKTWDSLKQAPLFASIAEELLAFVAGAELIIHNAPFDVGFIDSELRRWRPTHPGLASLCAITDTLVMAKTLHPGQRNSLDALARRYAVEERDRSFHGALLDAEILADVYLAMTGGQVGLAFGGGNEGADGSPQQAEAPRAIAAQTAALRVQMATPEELQRHARSLQALGEAALWS